MTYRRHPTVRLTTALCTVLLVAGCTAYRPPAATRPEISAPPRPKSLQGRLLAAHNAWRQKVGVPPLQWSASLARFAQQWADTLQAQDCRPEHRPANAYGENIEWASGQRLTPEQVVALWGGEKKFYSYAANSCQFGKNCLHYTQLVWRSTTAVGCGLARCGNSEVWVCNYAPPGNWVGKKPY